MQPPEAKCGRFAAMAKKAGATVCTRFVTGTSWAIFLGGNLGAAWTRSGYTYDNGVLEDFSFNTNSMIGGGHAGVQGQWGSWLIGVEGSFDGTDLSRTVIGLNSSFES